MSFFQRQNRDRYRRYQRHSTRAYAGRRHSRRQKLSPKYRDEDGVLRTATKFQHTPLLPEISNQPCTNEALVLHPGALYRLDIRNFSAYLAGDRQAYTLSVDDWQDTIATNLNAVFIC